MLRVTAEIWPGGAWEHAYTIGEICAANISDLADVSNYAVEVREQSDEGTGDLGAPGHAFNVLQHERNKGVWELVRRITSQHELTKDDVAVGLGAVVELATLVLGTPHAAVDWVGQPASGLGDQRPIDLIHTSEGVDQVLTLLWRAYYGVYA
jgi:hypothetical protein